MNKKQVAILQHFIDKSNWRISQLGAELSLSPRMVRHELKEINPYLECAKLPAIVVDRRSGLRWQADEKQKQALAGLLSSLGSYDYCLSSLERQTLITLFMLASDGYLTSTGFAARLAVSKSCIDKDLSALRDSLASEGIVLESCAGKGSRICGNEQLLRSYCCRVITQYVDLYDFMRDELPLDSYVARCTRELYCDLFFRPLYVILKKAENDIICRQFSDKSFSGIVTYLAVTLVRVAKGHLSAGTASQYLNVDDSDEYHFAVQLADSIYGQLNIRLPEKEISYITVLLRGAQYVERCPYDKEDWAEIQLLTSRLIKEMSLLMGMDFCSDTELRQSLQIHLGRTVSNLRHNITTVNPTLVDIAGRYHDYFETMQSVVAQTNTELLRGISDDEIAYLAVHFCASTERIKRSHVAAQVAIVCTNGAGTASLLKELLCSRSPNIRVAAITTSSDICRLNAQAIDFVISSVLLPNCPYPFIKVNAIPTPDDYKAVDSMIHEHAGAHLRSSEVTKLYSDILEATQSFINMPEGDGFAQRLKECFERNGFETGESRLCSSMLELLPVEHIQCGCTADNWEQAVRVACRPMLNSMAVTEAYISSAIASVRRSGPYIVLAQGIALVHSQIGCGVNRLSVGLCTFSEGVCFHHPEFDPVRVIICLAPSDSSSHTNILSDIIRLLDRTDAEKLTQFIRREELLDHLRTVLDSESARRAAP